MKYIKKYYAIDQNNSLIYTKGRIDLNTDIPITYLKSVYLIKNILMTHILVKLNNDAKGIIREKMSSK